MNVRKLLVFLVVLVTVSAIALKVYLEQASSANLAANSGFETAGGGGGDIWANWTESAAGMLDEGVIVHGGTHAAKFTIGASPVASVTKATGFLIAGHRMRLTFWTRSDDSGGSLRFSIWDPTNAAWVTNEGPPGDPAHIPTGVKGTTYTEVIYEFVVPAGTDTVWTTFAGSDYYSGGPAVSYLDDVEIVDLDGVTWTDISADVLTRPAPRWGRGLNGGGVLDLVAGPGVLAFTLDNSASSVTGRLAGQYSPAHANALFGFGLGSPIKATLEVDGGGEVVAFIGRVSSIRPSSGAYRDEMVEVEAVDWMNYPASQLLGLVTLAVNQRMDEGLTTILANFPIQPEATDFDTGVETFVTMYGGETAQTLMRDFFSKLARNEFGRIFLKADGTLVVENRDARPLNLTSAFTLDGTMGELQILYDLDDVANIILATIYPARTDTVAVRIFDLGNVGTPAIAPGETLTFICPYSDPLGGGPIAATSVVDPVTVVEFGSTADYVSNNLAAFLSQANEVGANALIAHLTNTGTVTGYLNDFQVYGLGIYHYSPIEMERRDDFDIALNGERRATYRLELITDPNKGRNYADFILDKVGRQHVGLRLIRFNANQTATLAAAAVAAEVSTRFTLTEAATGLSEDCFINRLSFGYIDGQLEVDILAVPASTYKCWIWDSSTWDNSDGEGWAL